MASASTIAKYIKSVGTYSEGEVSEIVSKLPRDDQTQLQEIVKEIHGKLQQANFKAVEKKKDERQLQTPRNLI